MLNITCNLNPLISPVITSPEFAFHTGTNCGPWDDLLQLFPLVVYLWFEGVFPLCGVLFLLLCGEIGVCCLLDAN